MSTENWDPAPWAVGGGVQHSTNVGRLLAFMAFAGKEGIVRGRDLRVRELAVPGSKVRVMPGACGIINRAASTEEDDSKEAYAGRLPKQDEVDIDPGPTSGDRYDMIVARVENPFISGEDYQEPEDPLTGRYIFSRLIPNVSSTAETRDDVPALHRSESWIPLARVKMPAGATTVTQDRITDLRTMVAPRKETIQRVINLPDGSANDALGSSNFTVWPTQANWNFRIPEWATMCQLKGTISSAQLYDGDASGASWWGKLRMQHGNMFTQEIQLNLDSTVGDGKVNTAPTLVVAGDKEIPADHRGTVRDLSLQGLRTNSSGGMVLRTGWGTTVVLEVTYYEAPDDQGWEN